VGINQIFERDFCDFLEYRICNLLSGNSAEPIKGFWCDGVIYETMLEDKIALFTVFTGKSGQVKYKLFLHLGEISLSLHSKKTDIRSCIPTSYCADTFTVDIDRKRMYIYAS